MAELAAAAPRLWPTVWVEAVTAGVQSTTVLSGSPIAEYMPSRLARGTLAIVGAAAHAVSPMTGRGHLTGVEDAAPQAKLLASKPPTESVAVTLARFESERLPFVQGLVARSRTLSEDYRRYASAHRR